MKNYSNVCVRISIKISHSHDQFSSKFLIILWLGIVIAVFTIQETIYGFIAIEQNKTSLQ